MLYKISNFEISHFGKCASHPPWLTWDFKPSAMAPQVFLTVYRPLQVLIHYEQHISKYSLEKEYIYILDAIEAYGLNCSKHSYQEFQESLIPHFLSGIPFPLPSIAYLYPLPLGSGPSIKKPSSLKHYPLPLIPCPLLSSLSPVPLSLVTYPLSLKTCKRQQILSSPECGSRNFRIRIDSSCQVNVHQK